MRRKRNMFQVREQEKTPEKELSETEMSILPDRVQTKSVKDAH